ncbi:MAG TPA: YlbF family regulator [Verrucomicrobiota bacterium]|nr:YlbF family regulator [Verrucomicrobiota bacterium]
MEYNQNSSPVVVKLQELCKALVDDPQFASIRDRVSLFLSDEETRRQYENLNNKGMMLHGKQQSGVELTEEEINDFEKDRDMLLNNPIAMGFIEAQQEINKIKNLIDQHISRTFELGRVPTVEDFTGCDSGCGPGCSCGQ